MRIERAVALAVLLIAGVAAVGFARQPQAQRFPDASMAAPPNWTGPRFRLSQSYPRGVTSSDRYPWQAIDFRADASGYLRAVLQYCTEGNDAVDWDVTQNAVRPWFHVPWLHWGRNGREPIRGLTHERVSEPFELAPTQSRRFQNWAVGFYNAPGGYVIGQVWENADRPNPALARFPEGTVSCKLLFTEASVDQVPYLRGSLEWDAYIYTDIVQPTNPRMSRSVRRLRLLQIDVAVRDRRADATTGWVLGTFVYNGEASGLSVWDRMIPVGLMWGNDPTVTAAQVNSGATLRETVLSPSSGLPLHTVQSPRQHLGWAGRLNGPVDNPMSSCLSCHSVAQYPALSPMMPPRAAAPGTPQWMHWFRNIRAGDPFDAEATSLDYSLQLAVSIQNFDEFQNLMSSRGGHSVSSAPPTPFGVFKTRSGALRQIFELLRDPRSDSDREP